MKMAIRMEIGFPYYFQDPYFFHIVDFENFFQCQLRLTSTIVKWQMCNTHERKKMVVIT